MTRVAGYARVSTRRQEQEGLSLDEQKATLAAECAHHGWELAVVVVEASSGKSLSTRGELVALLAELDRGDYDVLMVTHMDRIARSLLDFLTICEQGLRHDWALYMKHPNVDMTDPFGKAIAQMAGVFAELNGALISQKTREGLAYARARGTFRPGEHLRYDSEPVVARIMRWSEQGLGGERIAVRLEEERVKPPRGERWHPKTIRRIIAREKAACT